MMVDFLFIGLQEINRVQTRLAQLSFSCNISWIPTIDKLSFLLIIISRVMNRHAEMSIKVRMRHELDISSAPTFHYRCIGKR